MWINPTDITVEHPLVEWNTGSGFQTHFWHSVNGGSAAGNLFANILSPGGAYHSLNSASGLVQLNVWQHVAVTYDRATGIATLYLNGVVVAQQNLGSFMPLTTADLYFGYRPNSGEVYAGQFDEIDLFHRALSAVEIQRIYQAGTAGKCSSQVSPASLDFGGAAVNTVSAVQTVTLTNQKPGALRVLGIKASAPFAQTNTCTQVIPPAGTCSISVTFNPVVTGTTAGQVSVVDDSAEVPHTVALIGTGT